MHDPTIDVFDPRRTAVTFSFRRKLAPRALQLAVLMSAHLAHAQSCPLSLDNSSTLKLTTIGWTRIGDSIGVERLHGFYVIEGKLSPYGQAADSYILAPQLAGNLNIWHFPKKVGVNEVWIQCIYSGGTLLNRRLDASVRRCTSKLEPRDQDGRRLLGSSRCFE